MSNSLRPHGLQHASLPCPSSTPRACSNSGPQVGDAIQPSHPVVPFSSCFQSFPASECFLMIQFFTSHGESIVASASASVLLMNSQDWFPLGLSGWISLQSKGLSRVFSKSINSALSFLYSPTFTSIHDHWKTHSLDEMDLCWQGNVSAF